MSAAEPLPAAQIDEICAWLADVERDRPVGDKITLMVARLLATVRDRDKEIADMMAEWKQMAGDLARRSR